MVLTTGMRAKRSSLMRRARCTRYAFTARPTKYSVITPQISPIPGQYNWSGTISLMTGANSRSATPANQKMT